MDPVELEFERRLRDSIDESIKLGYNPIRFTEMVNVHGGKKAARLLVESGEIQEGLQRLVKMGYPKLSVESIMLEAEFSPLFPTEILAAAQWRLEHAEERVRESGERHPTA
jgi:hypothetical protein